MQQHTRTNVIMVDYPSSKSFTKSSFGNLQSFTDYNNNQAPYIL